jgi:ribosomal protein S18 acetylase RimI-like enzyme
MTSVHVLDYRPDPALDTELADLGYAALFGWPDQSPITAALVRSWLRPSGTTATTLALQRGDEGQLLGAAALTWPSTLDAPAYLWGPVVHPTVQRGGMGATLLGAMSDILTSRPGIRVITSEIPETRKAGWALYERAGWRNTSTASLLTRTLPAPASVPSLVPVRTMRSGEYLDPALAELFAAARPDLGYATARDTYTRWTTDERYDPDGLLLVDGPDGLVGAALVYPVTHNRYGQPHEATLADLIVSTSLPALAASGVREALVGAALDVGADLGAAIARAVVDDEDLIATLHAAGFDTVDQIRYYSLLAN